MDIIFFLLFVLGLAGASYFAIILGERAVIATRRGYTLEELEDAVMSEEDWA